MVVHLDDPAAFAERIRMAMSARGIDSEAELARRTGESRQTINRWLNGHAHTMRAPSFMRVCIALNVNGVWLALGQSNMSRAISMSPDESRLVELFRAAPPSQQQAVLALLESVLPLRTPPQDLG